MTRSGAPARPRCGAPQECGCGARRGPLSRAATPPAARERLVADERTRTAELLAHLAEVDERRLYLEHATSSLFAYCVEVLGFSEDMAWRRVQAARLARAYPRIFELVASGELHLTALALLAPHLREDNQRDLLEAARHKTKRQVEELLAERFPRADQPVTLRKLPEPRTVAAPALFAASAGRQPSEGAPQAAPREQIVTAPAPVAAAPAHRPKLEPLAPGRYRLALTLDAQAKASLEHARDLLAHKEPGCDFARVVELALACLVEQLERRKFAMRRRAEGRGQAMPVAQAEVESPAPARVPPTAGDGRGSDAHPFASHPRCRSPRRRRARRAPLHLHRPAWSSLRGARAPRVSSSRAVRARRAGDRRQPHATLCASQRPLGAARLPAGLARRAAAPAVIGRSPLVPSPQHRCRLRMVRRLGGRSRPPPLAL